MYPEVKVCGITREKEAEWISEAGVGYAGFVLYEKSKRYVTIEKAKQIFNKLNDDIIKVAVVVTPDAEKIEEICCSGFDIIQVHGELRQESLKKAALPIWRALNLPEKGRIPTERLTGQGSLEGLEDPETTDQNKKITAFLADAKAWGSGRTFGWEHWETEPELRGELPEQFRAFRKALKKNQMQFILAGGLNAENAAAGISLFAPDIVDVSTGVEAEDGNGKNRGRILAFMEQVRESGSRRIKEFEKK